MGTYGAGQFLLGEVTLGKYRQVKFYPPKFIEHPVYYIYLRPFYGGCSCVFQRGYGHAYGRVQNCLVVGCELRRAIFRVLVAWDEGVHSVV